MRAIRSSLLFPLAFVIASLYGLQVNAQVGTGTISGVVMDPSGAFVVGALVSITNSQTGVVTSATTNSYGRYVVPDLIVGKYDVQATKQDFEAQVIRQVLLTVGANIVVDCKLAVGQQITKLTVTEFSQVDTSTAEISALIGREQMENLPLNGRNFEQLILLAPGVQAVTSGVPEFVLRQSAILLDFGISARRSGTATGRCDHTRVLETWRRQQHHWDFARCRRHWRISAPHKLL